MNGFCFFKYKYVRIKSMVVCLIICHTISNFSFIIFHFPNSVFHFLIILHHISLKFVYLVSLCNIKNYL